MKSSLNHYNNEKWFTTLKKIKRIFNIEKNATKKLSVFGPRGQHQEPPSPLVDLRGLFMNPPSPLSGPHGLRMTPKTVIYNSSLKYQTKLNRMIQN